MSDFNIQFEEQDQVITLEFEQAGGGAVKSVNGKTGVVVLDAEDVGAYTKPSGGIPKTDLASSVQTSLGKADSAYQKPSGGIPASDIASGAIPTVDNTLTTAGAAADAKKVGDEISDLKDDLTNGNFNQKVKINPFVTASSHILGTVRGNRGSVDVSNPSYLKVVRSSASPTFLTYGCYFAVDSTIVGANANHKIYVKISGLDDSGTTNIYAWRIYGTSNGTTQGIASVDFTGSDYENIFTLTADVGQFNILLVTSAAAASGSYFTVGSVQWIDLTEMFGAGYEPTIAQFKAVYDSFPYDFCVPTTLTDLREAKTLIERAVETAFATDTATGTIASFHDGADNVPAKSLTVNVEPVQDLHGQANPYPAGGGKNLLDPSKYNKESSAVVNGVTWTFDGNGTLTANGTATNDSTVAFNIKGMLPSANYYFCGNISVNNANINTYVWNLTTNSRCKKWDGTTNVVNSTYSANLQQVQLNATDDIIFNCRVLSGTTVSNAVFKPMIIKSTDTDTTFVPYENICPITGHTQAKVTRTGKNFVPRPTWQTFTKSGITATILDDGRVRVSGTGTNTGFDIIIFSQFLLPAGSYIFNGQNGVDPTNQFLTLQLYNKTSETQFVNKSTASDYAFSLTKETLIEIRIGLRVGISVTNAIMSPMIRLATDADATYEPYQGQQYTIDLDGTRYGGTLDVITGVLTVDRAMVDLGSLTWTYYTSGTYPILYAEPSGHRAYVNGEHTDAICENYSEGNPAAARSTLASGNLPDKSFSWISGPSGSFTVRDSSYTSAAAFKTAMDGVKLVYPLATPFTVQLSTNEVRTLLGHNNIWSDTGDTTVEYRADTSLYIKKLTGSTEDDMVADANIVSGQYFMVGNTLYKATANIASGGAITPNVNCTRKSLPEALNEINA